MNVEDLEFLLNYIRDNRKSSLKKRSLKKSRKKEVKTSKELAMELDSLVPPQLKAYMIKNKLEFYNRLVCGVYGCTYLLKHVDREEYKVVKVIPLYPYDKKGVRINPYVSPEIEMKLQDYASHPRHLLSPKIYFSCYNRAEDFYWIISEYLDETLFDFIKKIAGLSSEKLRKVRKRLITQLMRLFIGFNHLNMTHGDLHVGNVMLRYSSGPTAEHPMGKFVLYAIDYGRASTFVYMPEIDIVQLLRSLFSSLVGNGNRRQLYVDLRSQLKDNIWNKIIKDRLNGEEFPKMKTKEAFAEQFRKLNRSYRPHIGFKNDLLTKIK